MAPKVRESIDIETAVNNLEAIAAIDINAPGPIGILQNKRIVTDEEEFPRENVEWLEGEGAEVLLEIVDVTLRSVYDYLVRFAGGRGAEDEIAELMHLPEELEVPSDRIYKAVSMLMALVSDCVHKMDRFLELRLGRSVGKIEDRAEFQTLRDFYQRNFSSKFHELEPHLPNTFAIQDMDQVRLDKEYELFYIRNEEGIPFYDLEILRNMRIISDFDTEGEFEEDPLLKIRSILDRDAAASAGQILGDCERSIVEFFKVARKTEPNTLIERLNHSCMALFLSHNPRNLLQNTMGKTSLQYFEDFHRFLREALRTSEYQKLIAYPPDKSDRLAYALLNVAHSLAKSLFHRAGGVKEETIALIHRIGHKGKQPKAKANSLWSHFTLEDEAYRELLSKFPSGPLLKILDILRSEEESAPFDPIGQGNYPMALFSAGWDSFQFDLLHLPCPTSQEVINKAKIVEEFSAFLRHYHSVSPSEKHLLINLQDPTSWKESARCSALTALQKHAEFSQTLILVTFPKSGDFYYQTAESDFLPALLKAYADVPFQPLHEPLAELIQSHFFKGSLSPQDRLDFIEIFQLILTLKIIDHHKPHSLSFTCKDAIDAGAAQSAALYAFLRILNEDFTTQEAHDYFRWLLYAPALFIRERSLDNERLNRTLSALAKIDQVILQKGYSFLKDLERLFKFNIIKGLKVN
jgi:hypothetical protein